MPKKKSKKKKKTISKSLFKITGASVKMKIDDKKEKTYYFSTKIKPEKASKLASADGAEILGVAPDALKVSKPKLKYDFYCMYNAVLEMKFLRIRNQELGVNEQVTGVMVGKEILKPKKGKEVPGKAIRIDLIELIEYERTDAMVLDGSTGSPARSMEKLFKKAGKKKATSAWIRKASVTSGKFNSTKKVVKAVAKLARKAPKEAKRVVEHDLTFTQLDGIYIPTYYIKVRAGENARTMRINAVNGNVALKV
jgi:hypothetical protein